MPNLVYVQCMAGARHALTPKFKGLKVKVTECAAGVGLQVNTTASVL